MEYREGQQLTTLNQRALNFRQNRRSSPPVRSRLVDSPFDWLGGPISFPRNAGIFGEGELAEYFYKIESGYVRTFRIIKDGRRHIDAFYIPGEVFGLESRDMHALSAEAITSCRIQLARKSTIFKRSIKDRSALAFLFTETLVALHRTQTHSNLLLKAAQERVVGFLLDMAKREGQNEIDLPMTRGDIADYVGLSTETVSRMLWKLENISAISVKRRSVMLLDMQALERIGG